MTPYNMITVHEKGSDVNNTRYLLIPNLSSGLLSEMKKYLFSAKIMKVHFQIGKLLV